MKKIFTGVYRIGKNIATINNVRGFRVYDEKLVNVKDVEYRTWSPYRSKLAAAIHKGLKKFPFKENSNVLYLGASSGTTASHISDICFNGDIYCVEISKRMMRELISVAEKKENIIPILADANHPEVYIHKVTNVNIIYQDVAQPNQADILERNSEFFHPENAIIAIKARSINTIESPKKVFKKEINRLKERFHILETIDLKPYDKDHILVNLKSKNKIKK